MDTLSTARRCWEDDLGFIKEDGCVPFDMGRHAHNGRPLELRFASGGCIADPGLPMLRLAYKGVDTETCDCIGLSERTCGPCLVVDTTQRSKAGPDSRRQAWTYLERAPLGIHYALVSEPEIVLADRTRVERHGRRRKFQLERVRMQTRDPFPEAPTREVVYRRVSIEDFHQRLDPQALLDLSKRLRETCSSRPTSGFGSAHLDWSVGQSRDTLELPFRCSEAIDVLSQLEERLKDLPTLDECDTTTAIPFGGLECMPGVRDAPTLGIRVGAVETRIVTPPLEAALCAGLGSVLASPRVKGP
ncbi:MAG: hypothetical protein QM778_28820 [Myxococcales bacterium]